MKTQQFLDHHGVVRNPFAEEDAQSDQVFKDHCISDTYHPAWDKIYGEPMEPATSVVFGEKGAGKTAMRLQIAGHLERFNQQHLESKCFVIQYDDFNPYLDRFASRLPMRRRRVDRVLANLRLWDHMDAILAIGVTDLIERVLHAGRSAAGHPLTSNELSNMDRHQRRDLLLLAACYDQSTDAPSYQRWKALKRRLRWFSLKAWLPSLLGVAVTAGVVYFATLVFTAHEEAGLANLRARIPLWAYLAIIVVGWLPWLVKASVRLATALGIARSTRVVNWPISSLWRVLMRFPGGELSGQPLPNRDRSDDRYELLTKFQAVLQALGYGGVFVLVDRVDEPHLINGSAELMRALVWPLLDNKFLKHPGIGTKLLLPAELKYFVDREGKEFSQRARLDKQNMVPSLAWTGEALYDVANSRLRACAAKGATPNIRDFLDPAIGDARMFDAFRTLRVPRHLFKFMYQLMVSHCNAYTDEAPQWKVTSDRFESELAVYEREHLDPRR